MNCLAVFGGQRGCHCLSLVFPSPSVEILSSIKPLSVPNNWCLSFIFVVLVFEGNCFILGNSK